MKLAHVPAVFMRDHLVKWVSMRPVHDVAALIFAVLGMLNVGRLH